MKNIIMATALAAIALTACNNNNDGNHTGAHVGADHPGMNDSAMGHMQDDHGNNMGGMEGTTHAGMMENASVNQVMSAYIQVKNALANDDTKAASKAGSDVVSAINAVDVTQFSAAQKKVYEDVREDMKEHGEHIVSNSGNIAHQREHFETLSKDMYDLVKVFGTSKTMYYTHCPMYNNNKGANWISEVKDISNPYMGKKMAECGTINEELK